MREIPLDQVAAHVSYPPASGPVDAPRPYLAVRDVRIYCPFPNNPVRDLTLIDLPGTQERGIDVAQQFMQDLRNEVDLLLQIKRPRQTTVHFSESDTEIQRLARAASAGAAIGDFMIILLNHDAEHTDLTRSQFDTATQQARGAVGMHGIQVLTADVVQEHEVRERVLVPVLSHLAARLATMDQAAFGAAREGTEAAGRRAVEAVAGLAEALRRENVALPTEDALVSELVTRLRRGLSDALGDIADDYLRRVQEGRRTDELDAAVEKAVEEVRAWMAAGFGHSAPRRVAQRGPLRRQDAPARHRGAGVHPQPPLRVRHLQEGRGRLHGPGDRRAAAAGDGGVVEPSAGGDAAGAALADGAGRVAARRRARGPRHDRGRPGRPEHRLRGPEPVPADRAAHRDGHRRQGEDPRRPRAGGQLVRPAA
ncbi:hypothetical protein ACFSTC_53770 [Nonomuraea ferruginea]